MSDVPIAPASDCDFADLRLAVEVRRSLREIDRGMAAAGMTEAEKLTAMLGIMVRGTISTLPADQRQALDQGLGLPPDIQCEAERLQAIQLRAAGILLAGE